MHSRSLAGYDFQLQLGPCVALVEVKGIVGNVRDAKVLLSMNQLERMQQVRDGEQYLVMVVANAGQAGQEVHRFFTREEVEQIAYTQMLCCVRGEGQEGESCTT